MSKGKKTKKTKPSPADVVGDKLNAKQELFCRLYAGDDGCFGNGTRAYRKAYGVKDDVARASAPRLLANVSVAARIGQLLDLTLNDAVVDRQLAFVVMQQANLPAKVAAIREYNRVRKRASDSDPNQTIMIQWGDDES